MDRLRRVAPVDYKKLHNKGKGKTPSDKGAKGYIDSSSSDDGLVDRKNPWDPHTRLGKCHLGKPQKLPEVVWRTLTTKWFDYKMS